MFLVLFKKDIPLQFITSARRFQGRTTHSDPAVVIVNVSLFSM